MGAIDGDNLPRVSINENGHLVLDPNGKEFPLYVGGQFIYRSKKYEMIVSDSTTRILRAQQFNDPKQVLIIGRKVLKEMIMVGFKTLRPVDA